jgi:hypothetical protein
MGRAIHLVREHQAVDARPVEGETDIGPAHGREAPTFGRAGDRGGQTRAEIAEPGLGHGGQQRGAVGEMPVGRVVRHAGAPRGLAQRHGGRPDLLHQRRRRRDQGSGEVAVVIGRARAASGGCAARC